MLRKFATGLGVALAIFGGMASTAGLAQATDPHDDGVTQSGRWEYIRWYKGASLKVYMQCSEDAIRKYPDQGYDCRIKDDTTQMWIYFE